MFTTRHPPSAAARSWMLFTPVYRGSPPTESAYLLARGESLHPPPSSGGGTNKGTWRRSRRCALRGGAR